MNTPKNKLPEPWLRGTLSEFPSVLRAVLHALELAKEDIHKGCGDLSDDELNARPFGLPSIGFHLLHIAGSIDRLLTYAEGKPLSEIQLLEGKSEGMAPVRGAELFVNLDAAFAQSVTRISKLDVSLLNEPRTVGRKQLPTTLAGLVVHVADHTQRHVGQALTTAKLIRAQRES